MVNSDIWIHFKNSFKRQSCSLKKTSWHITIIHLKWQLILKKGIWRQQIGGRPLKLTQTWMLQSKNETSWHTTIIHLERRVLLKRARDVNVTLWNYSVLTCHQIHLKWEGDLIIYMTSSLHFWNYCVIKS